MILVLPISVDITIKRYQNSNQWVNTFVSHGLKITSDSAISFSIKFGVIAPKDLLFNLRNFLCLALLG